MTVNKHSKSQEKKAHTQKHDKIQTSARLRIRKYEIYIRYDIKINHISHINEAKKNKITY